MAGGSLSSQKFRDVHRLDDMQNIDFMLIMCGLIGWGRFHLEHCDLAIKELYVSVSHSPFAETFGDSSHSVCHLIRGILARTASVVFGTDCSAQETECVAEGD